MATEDYVGYNLVSDILVSEEYLYDDLGVGSILVFN
jgi:hypothetical protein